MEDANHFREMFAAEGAEATKDAVATLREKLRRSAGTIKTPAELKEFERIFFGRKGEIARLSKRLRELPAGERKKFGQALNELKSEAAETIEQLKVSKSPQKLGQSQLDVTRPGSKIARGHLHPLTLVTREVKRIFLAMGFSVVEGPEVETEWYNFDALNIPPEHPARDLMDTFWLRSAHARHSEPFDFAQDKLREESRRVSDEILRPSGPQDDEGRLLLRTHTSPMQVRYMQGHRPPLRIIVPGRVFRYEASDASHDVQFTQVEGLMVDKAVSVANFKAVIQSFFERFFRKDIKTRLRPGYFPFVEPGFEVDVNCPRCRGKGCGSCKHSGWLELMGAGMVHQNVFKNAGYPTGTYTGFAFGMGLDRLAMVKYGIDDIRLFYGGDLRFLRQF